MKMIKLMIATALALSASFSWAGVTYSHEVAVSDTFLMGGVSAADQSQDSNQYVGCYISSYDTGAVVVCIARDKNNTPKSCMDSSPNEATLNAVSGINDSSYIYAMIDNGKCTRITIHSSSAFIE